MFDDRSYAKLPPRNWQTVGDYQQWAMAFYVRVVGTHRKDGPMGELMREPSGEREVEVEVEALVKSALSVARQFLLVEVADRKHNVDPADKSDPGYADYVKPAEDALIKIDAAIDAMRAREKSDV